MDREEAETKFWEADRLYRAGEYAEALELLIALDEEFPNNHRLLFARARTLAKLGQTHEALVLCDRLVDEFGYERAARLRYRLLAHSKTPLVQAATPFVDEDDESQAGEPEAGTSRVSRFRIKPIRLLILIGLVAGMATGRIPYWLGGGLIVGYFGIKFALNAALLRLFSIPFRMKGKALANATAEVHAVTPAPAPRLAVHEDEDEDAPRRKDLIYYYVDVTITPQSRTQGFRHWEPGELVLATAKTRIKSLNDLDKCFTIHDVKFVQNGSIKDDDGEKFIGPARLKIYVGVPASEREFKFVYYTESFGTVEMTD